MKEKKKIKGTKDKQLDMFSSSKKNYIKSGTANVDYSSDEPGKVDAANSDKIASRDKFSESRTITSDEVRTRRGREAAGKGLSSFAMKIFGLSVPTGLKNADIVYSPTWNQMPQSAGPALSSSDQKEFQRALEIGFRSVT